MSAERHARHLVENRQGGQREELREGARGRTGIEPHELADPGRDMGPHDCCGIFVICRDDGTDNGPPPEEARKSVGRQLTPGGWRVPLAESA
jgi:hypothetical protein